MTNNDFCTNDMFIESPIFDNWFKKYYPQKSFWICSPYIKSDALDKIISLYKLDERDSDFDLKVLIRGNDNEFTHNKSSDVSIFDTLICLKGMNLSNIRRVTNLHMKAYLIDGKHLLVTSGNLTNNGLFAVSGKENFEGSISTNDPVLIHTFQEYFSHIWNQGEVLEKFYDILMSAYTTYIEHEYSDKRALQRLNRRKYVFNTKTNFGDIKTASKSKGNDINITENFSNDSKEVSADITRNFSLDDIPPAGQLIHIPAVLKYVAKYSDGVTFRDLGNYLRPLFSDDASTEVGADRKFGEEKGKFAAFLNLVNIETTSHGNLVKISNLGKTYLAFDDEAKNKLIKDVFFEKPIVSSIMKQSLETPDFDLMDFLLKNCKGKDNQPAKRSTLSRKISPLKKLFSYISSICTEEELKTALTNM